MRRKRTSFRTKADEMSNQIDEKTKKQMIRLFQSFDKAEFMRIDCRVDKLGNIFVLELSPDCYVGSKGAFFETVKQNGISFEHMIKMMVDNSINSQSC